MFMEIELCPFERSVVGSKGHVLVRHNREHAERATRAIRRRSHPAWSSLRDSFHFTATRIETGTAGTVKQGPARRVRAGNVAQKDSPND